MNGFPLPLPRFAFDGTRRPPMFARLGAPFVVLLALATPAQAAFINGSFETADLTGWQKAGDALTVDATFGVTPIAGNRAALITTASNNGDFNNFSGTDAV